MTRRRYAFWIIVAAFIFTGGSYGLSFAASIIETQAGEERAARLAAMAATSTMFLIWRLASTVFVTLLTIRRLGRAKLSRWWAFVLFPLLLHGLTVFHFPGRAIGDGFWQAATSGQISVPWIFLGAMTIILFLCIFDTPAKKFWKSHDSLHRVTSILAAVSGIALAIWTWAAALLPFSIIPYVGEYVSRAGQFIDGTLKQPLDYLDGTGFDVPMVFTIILMSMFAVGLFNWKVPLRVEFAPGFPD